MLNMVEISSSDVSSHVYYNNQSFVDVHVLNNNANVVSKSTKLRSTFPHWPERGQGRFIMDHIETGDPE